MPPVIDPAKCIGCGTCANICPTQVYRRVSGVRIPEILFGDECWHCNSCVLDCPGGAIRLRMPLTHRLLYVDASSLTSDDCAFSSGDRDGNARRQTDRHDDNDGASATRGEESC